MNRNNEGPKMNYADMKLPELKALAKDLKIKGYSTMKKADLVTAIEANDKIKSGLDNSAKGNVKSLGDFVKPESMVDAIKAAIRVAKEARSAKGRKAGQAAQAQYKVHPVTKAETYRLQRGSETAKLTAPQARRLRKAERQLGHTLTYV